MKLRNTLVLAFILFYSVCVSVVLAEEGFAVVELFTSEGCSSCPAADQVLRDIKTRAEATGTNIYPLGFHVSYWDYLGWKDRFSNDTFNTRQRQYAKVLGSSVYTPQMIVNGQTQFGGYRANVARDTIDAALSIPTNIFLNLNLVSNDKGLLDVKYEVSSVPANSILNIVLVENEAESVIQKGENLGKTLIHANVVRSFKTEPLKASGTSQITLPEDLIPTNSSIIAFIQNTKTHAILTANKLSF